MILKLTSCKPTVSQFGSTSVTVLSITGVSLLALFCFVAWPTARSQVSPRLELSGSERLTYASNASSKTTPPIELGVVPVNESRRLLFPVPRLGIAEDAVIDSITTSCECIQASVVVSSDSRALQDMSPTRWIAIEHLPEKDGKEFSSMLFRVECTVLLSNSTTQSFTVEFESISHNDLASVSSIPEPMTLDTGGEAKASLSKKPSKLEANGSVRLGLTQ